MPFVSIEQRRAAAVRVLVTDLTEILTPHLTGLKVEPPNAYLDGYRATGTITAPDDVPMARDELLRRADRAIAAVELGCWRHNRHPTIEIGGGPVLPLKDVPVLWPTCWLYLDVLPGALI